jgi:hypothetical protein
MRLGVLEEATVTFLATTSRQVLPRAASWPGKLNQSVNQDQAVPRAALATVGRCINGPYGPSVQVSTPSISQRGGETAQVAVHRRAAK